MTPEQIGLCGCWQIIAVYRDRIQLDREADSSESTIAYYVTSRTKDESSDQELLMAIRGHWSAIENGVHYRRDVSFGEDQCRIANQVAAHMMASLRNLAIALYELHTDKQQGYSVGLKSWCRSCKPSNALSLLRTGRM